MMARTPRPRVRIAVLVASLALASTATALAAPSWGNGQSATARTSAPRPIASRPTTKEAWTARLILPVNARSAPKASAKKIARLSTAAPYDGGPHVLLVVGVRSTKADGVWYRVRLTSRPNTAAGWVPDDAVRVTRTRYRVVVRLSTRKLRLLKAGRIVGSWTVAIGMPSNPTPTGRFAVSEVVKQAKPGGFYGTYIMTLSAHSLKLSEFDGGDGRVALHGTNRASLLGQAVSHGCVRLSNAVATKLGRTVPPGAPVDILR